MSSQPLAEQTGASLSALVAVMNRLLSPEGCPWDREQTIASLRPYLIEETFEVIEAIESGDAEEHCDELGDLLFQVVFQAALRARQNEFGIDDVIAAIETKLIRRHPHVFADAQAEDTAAVLTQWEDIKAQENVGKKARESTLDGIPVGLPALARAQKTGNRAARVGFDWPDVTGPLAKTREELAELEAAIEKGDKSVIEDELGDLLFSVVNTARHLQCDAETALRGATGKFSNRFRQIEREAKTSGRTLSELAPDELDELWNRAK